MTEIQPSVTENEQNVTSDSVTASRARPFSEGDVTVVTGDKTPCDVTDKRDSDRAPLRSGPITVTSGTWVLLWSQKQNTLHVEPLEKYLASNRAAYREDQPGDYRAVFVGSRDQVSASAGFMHGTLYLREDERAARRVML